MWRPSYYNAQPQPGAPSAPAAAGGQQFAASKEQSGQTQVFRFGAAVQERPTPEAGENRDQFEAVVPNIIKQVAAEPVSTFSIDVDTASYGFVRRGLLAGRVPPKEAVRVEEMVNYFAYAYPRPESAAVPFQPTVTVTPAPWKPTESWFTSASRATRSPQRNARAPTWCFLIDMSGSMAPDDRLPLLKNSFRMLLDELKPDDMVGIVTYASQSGVALEPTRVAERGKIVDVLDRLDAGGSTAGGAGCRTPTTWPR